MSALIDPADLVYEEKIVWLMSINDLDYVRQSLSRLASRGRAPAYHHGILVGYAVLSPQAKAAPASGTFRRRVFWLQGNDRGMGDVDTYASGAPSEAVDPRTVDPGVPGYKTERSEGGPASRAMRELGITLPKG